MGTVNHYKMKFPLCWLLGSLPVWGPMLARAQNLMVCIFDIISFSASFYYPFFPHCPANFFFLTMWVSRLKSLVSKVRYSE